MAEGRFNGSVCSAEELISEHANRKILQRTFRDVQLLQSFLILKNEERKIVPKVELNESSCQLIISVRRKDGQDYDESTSFQNLIANFSRHLKKNIYPSSLMNDTVFDKPEKFFN